ncbi:MAG: peptidoglycan -binding protein [Rhodospirillaceae bacterium]|nr:MAG: peptidoglycan -binding protein [Rhodospirillaceae bacterium]
MVIVFVLMIFVIGQLFLSQILTGKDAALAKLNSQLAELADMLALEQSNSAQLKAQVQQLSSELTKSTAERDDLHNQVLALTNERNKAQQQLAVTQDQAKQLEDAYKTIDADKQKIQALMTDIAALQSLRDDLQKKLNDTNANTETLTTEAQRRVELLNQQILAMRQQLAEISKALDLSEQKSKEQNVQITELGKRLNAALASKVAELARYRSEFFGRLREVLGNRQDIQIVGDRFVFQSEVLFDSGSADVTPAGQQQLDVLATTLILIAQEIPPEIHWVLRVDGFTDKRPISTPRFPSNWELSTARAIAVVKYLISRGIPAEHLAAAGFAEFNPLDSADTEEAYKKNRRIEMKFDQR